MRAAETIRTGAAYRLNVNKSKFYALAKRLFPEIEPMKKAEFKKHFRVRDYTLSFWSGSYHHSLFLGVCGGGPAFLDEWYAYDEDGEKVSGWEYVEPKIDELLELGMLEEVEASA
jgi:hypothetical protein